MFSSTFQLHIKIASDLKWHYFMFDCDSQVKLSSFRFFSMKWIGPISRDTVLLTILENLAQKPLILIKIILLTNNMHTFHCPFCFKSLLLVQTMTVKKMLGLTSLPYPIQHRFL